MADRKASRSRTRWSALPWLVGTVLAGLVALLLFLPVWAENLEGRALDILFQHGRLFPPRASDAIVHVDIDEDALDTVGRWPWPRSRLGRVVETLDRFGAKVIAFDLLFDEPSDDPAEDARFGAALRAARARTIVAITFPKPSESLAELAELPAGKEGLASVIRVLRRDVTLDADGVVQAAGVPETWSTPVHRWLRELKKEAIDAAVEDLRRAGRPTETEEDLVRELVPKSRRPSGRFPELGMIRDAIELRQSVDAIEGRLPPASEEFETALRIQTPVRPIVEGASGVGFVTAKPDRDGTMRRLPIFVEFGGRLYPQLGIAAAASFLGVSATDVEVSDARVRFGRVTLPHRRALTLISWPRLRETSGADDLWDLVRQRDVSVGAFGVLRQSAGDSPTAGHVSIGPLVELPLEEGKLAKQKDQLDRIGKEIVVAKLASGGVRPEDLDDPEKRASVLDALRDQIQFDLGDLPAAPDDSDETKVLRTWMELDQSVARGAANLAGVSTRLREKIAGKLVFVGWTTSGDVYPTATDALTPGVVVNAAFASMPLTGYAISESSRGLGVLVAFLIGSLGAAAGGIGRVGPRTGLLALLALALAYALVDAFLVFETGHVFLALATPLAALVSGWAAATVTRQVLLLREKARLSRQFGARVHKRLFEYLLEHPDVIDVAGVQREVTMLFTDLAGFTSVSETLDSRETVALLNRYMGAMNQVLTEHDAYVNKFLGDGIMAVWGAFDAEGDHADKACRAAIACLERLDRLKREEPAGGVDRLNMRLGIATGIVTVGDCGAPPDFSDYTVIGDAVNLAARLESANKQFGTRIAIDGRTRDLAGPNVIVRPLGAFVVVGQSKPTVVYECLAVKGGASTADVEAWADQTRRAVESFQQGRLEEARIAWQEFVETHGESKLAHLYLDEIEDVLERPTRPFDGSISLTRK